MYRLTDLSIISSIMNSGAVDGCSCTSLIFLSCGAAGVCLRAGDVMDRLIVRMALMN